MRVIEHIHPHQRAKFCREFRRYREQLVRSAEAMQQLRQMLRDERVQRAPGVRS